jgi:hypothetical protein
MVKQWGQQLERINMEEKSLIIKMQPPCSFYQSFLYL